MALPAGALTATITVGVSTDVTGEAGTITGLAVRPECRLVWAATGQPIEDWDVGAIDAATATLVVLADQDGVVTSGTVAGVPALVTIRSWPMLAEWTVRSADGQLRTIVRRFPASLLAAGGTLDLDLLPAHGVVPPAQITYAQSLQFGGGSAEEIAAAVAAYLLANPPAMDGYALTGHDHDGDYDPAGTAAGLVAAIPAPDLSGYVQTTDGRLSDARTPLAHDHAGVYDPAGTAAGAMSAHTQAADPHPGYTTAAEAAAAAPVQSVAGRTGAVTLAVADVSGAVASTDPRLADARTPTAHAASHKTGGADALTAADIGASATGHTHDYAASSHTHTLSAITDAGDAAALDVGTAAGTVAAGDHAHTGTYAPALGADDNYVTDAEKSALHAHSNKTALDAVSGTNTGDETQTSIKTKLGAATASADGYATATQITKLDGIAAGAEVNVNADWDSASGDSQILNKPDLTAYVAKSTVDAKGDLLVGSADNTVIRLEVGTTNGHVLTIDSKQTTGLKWAAGGGGGVGYVPAPTDVFVLPARSGVGPETTIGLAGATGPYYHYYGPTWRCADACKITAVRVVVTTAAADNTVRLALVEMDSDDQPLSLVADWGTVDASTTGDKDITGLSTTLQAGHWYASVLVRYGGGGSVAVRAWPVQYGHFGQDTSTPNRVRVGRYVLSSASGPTTSITTPPDWGTYLVGGVNSLAGPLDWMHARIGAV